MPIFINPPSYYIHLQGGRRHFAKKNTEHGKDGCYSTNDDYLQPYSHPKKVSRFSGKAILVHTIRIL